MTRFFTVFLLGIFLLPQSTFAEEITKNTAQMQAMDKITGRVNVINVPVGGEVKFGSLSIIVRKCQTRPVEETPDNFAFVDISDTTLQGNEINIFKGWMISSSPATHAVEHPIYDVWLLKCHDFQVKNPQLLSAEQLAMRDNLPIQRNGESAAKMTPQNNDAETLLMEMQAPEKNNYDTSASDMTTIEFLYDEDEDETESESGITNDESQKNDTVEGDMSTAENEEADTM